MGYYWSEYVPVSKRREQAAKHVKSAQKKGEMLNPVVIEGRRITTTFWGKAWCEHLEKYSDYENRLPRGRSYIRNGAVIDLQVSQGKIHAQVLGAYLYRVVIEIKAMNPLKWESLVKACAGKIDSLIELLQGRFSKGAMSLIIDPDAGLFPRPSEISMHCTCPDHASLCKHLASVLYGIGARLDTQPECLFTLRHVDHLELIASATACGIITSSSSDIDVLEESNLSALFGVEMATNTEPLP